MPLRGGGKRAADFERAFAAAEMPPLRPFVFETDYSPGDFATLLQAGPVPNCSISKR